MREAIYRRPGCPLRDEQIPLRFSAQLIDLDWILIHLRVDVDTDGRSHLLGSVRTQRTGSSWHPIQALGA